MGSLRIIVVGAGVSGIAVARGLLRDGHDVTVFDQRPNVTAGGGAVTIWSNGPTVLDQLGVDISGAGQPLSAVWGDDLVGSPAGHDRPGNDDEPVWSTDQDGPAPAPAGAAARRLPGRPYSPAVPAPSQ